MRFEPLDVTVMDWTMTECEGISLLVQVERFRHIVPIVAPPKLLVMPPMK
jgi:hypothetical protein